MSDSQFIIEKKGHIAYLTFNRPEKLNAMGPDFFRALTESFPKLDEDPEIRVVVIKAKGKSFTAGLDLVEAADALMVGDKAHDRENLRRLVLELQESMNVIENCRTPVIGAAHNHCVGAGIDLLSACDIRIASADVVFSVRETRIAIIADLGTLQRLQYIVGYGRANELALTGRDFGAEEALNMGFITSVSKSKEELDKEAEKLAEQIASLAPLAVQGVKDVVRFTRDHGINAGLKYVAQKNAAHLPSEDLVEAVTAFWEKRAPVFKGR